MPENNKNTSETEEKPKKKNCHSGHRQRVKDKMNEFGLDVFNDIQVMELMLFFAVPYKDTNEMGHALLDRFGSIAGVMRADREALMEVPGIGGNAADLIKFMQMFSRRYFVDEFTKLEKKQLNNSQNMGEFCKSLFLGDTSESFYAIALDSDLRILNFKKLYDGTPDSVSISPRPLIEFALKNKCVGVVISHNHPNGLCFPSRSDVVSTRALGAALEATDLCLIEHVVVGIDGYHCMSESFSWKGKW